MSLRSRLIRPCISKFSPAGPSARLSILMYHRILREPDCLTDSPHAAAFAVQMRALKEYFTVIPLIEAVEAMREGRLPSRAAAITFDDGYADNAIIALPILKSLGLPATIFVADGFLDGGRMFNDSVIEAVRRISSPVANFSLPGLTPMSLTSNQHRRAAIAAVLSHVKYLEPAAREEAIMRITAMAEEPLPDNLMMTREQVREISRQGLAVGGHTVSHPILATLSPDDARREIETNRRELQSITDKTPLLFAYPNGVPGKDYALCHVELVRAAGYAGAVTTSWGAAKTDSDSFQLPRFTPWDQQPVRFALRLLQNLVTNRSTQLDRTAGLGLAK